MRPDRFPCARALLLVVAAASTALAQPEAPPQDPGLRPYLSANGLLARGMNDLAAQEYRHFLDENPTHDRAPHARYGLGVALFRQKKYDEAEQSLAGLADLKGFEFAAESAFLRAQCALAAGRPADAAAPLQQVLKQHASHELADDAAALLAESQYRAARYPESISAAGALARSAPDSPLRDRAEYFAALSQIKSNDERAAATRLAALADAWPTSPLAEQAALLAAQCAHRAGDTAGAKRTYESLVERGGPQTPEALLGLAAVEQAANDLDAAREHLGRLIKDFPASPQAAAALLARARVLFAKGEYDPARADLARYAKTEGADRAQAALWTAKCHLRSGKPAQAARLLSSALEDLPEGSDLRPSMMYDLAVAQLDAGDEKDAIATLTRFRDDFATSALAPDATEALATLLHRTGDYDKSRELCAEFRAKFPNHKALPRIDLLTAENAFLADDAGAAEKAYTAFLGAHADDPGAALATFRLGCVYFRQDQHARAAPLLNQSAALADKDPVYRPALLYLGDIAFQSGRWAEADTLLARYIAFGDQTPSVDDALLKRGIALHNLGKDEDAAETLRALISGHPESGHVGLATLELSRSLLALHRDEEARELLRALARGKDPATAALANNRLAALAIARGDTKESADLFRAAAESGDEHAAPEALHGLATVLLSSGDTAGALRAFDRLIESYPGHARLPEARAQRAIARARDHADDEALAGLGAAIRSKDTLAPELRDALRYEQASCLRTLGRGPEADRALRTLAESASTPDLRIHAALDLARAEMESSRPAAAAEVLRSISPLLTEDGLDPALREHAEYQLAAAEFRQDHSKEAAALFTAFLAAHPGSALAPSASLLAAETLIRQNRHAQAIPHLRAALAAELPESDRQSAQLRLGEALAATQDWPGSEKAFADFLERYPSSDLWFQARFGRGWALENQGRHAEAMAEYAKVTATHQGPTAARAQFQIGECLFAQNKHEEAVRELLKVDILYAYPEWSAAALYEAGRCFEALKRPDKAQEQYRLVREKHPQTQWARLAAQRVAAIEPSTPSPKN